MSTKDVSPLTFKLSTFISLKAPHHDVVISVPWDTLIRRIGQQLKVLAKNRFDKAITDAARRRGSLGSFYTP